jgi:TonB family protein
VLHVAVIAAAASGGHSRIEPQRVERDTIRLDLVTSRRVTRLPVGEESKGAPDIIARPPLVPPIKPDPVGPPLRLDLPASPISKWDLAGLNHSDSAGGEIGPWDSVRSATEVDRLPEPTEEIRPRYPDVLQASGLSGMVELEYVITSSGRVDSASIVPGTSTHPAFTRSAVAALRRARFRPALSGGSPVPVRVRQRIRFVAR